MVLSRAQVAEFEEVIVQAFKKASFIEIISKNVVSLVEDQLKGTFAHYEEQIKNYKEQLAVLRAENEGMKKDYVIKLDAHEQYSRRNNVRIFGISEKEKENVEEIVTDILTKKIEYLMPENAIECYHRVGKKTARPRAIIVKFLSRKYKDEVVRWRSKLKGTKINIKEDLTQIRANHVKQLT
nr:uncharacterized protein LOC111415085 [Onthophagus taurus]